MENTVTADNPAGSKKFPTSLLIDVFGYLGEVAAVGENIGAV
jgi:hypothetical protein